MFVYSMCLYLCCRFYGCAGHRGAAETDRNRCRMRLCHIIGRHNCPYCGSPEREDTQNLFFVISNNAATNPTNHGRFLTDPTSTCSTISPVLALVTRTVVAQPLKDEKDTAFAVSGKGFVSRSGDGGSWICLYVQCVCRVYLYSWVGLP